MRRAFLRFCLGAAALALQPAAASSADDPNWAAFKRKFIRRGERVVDTGNDDVSHSESQGWGMLFAESNDDRETFLKLWEWTQAALQRPDSLFYWRWSPKGPEPVADKNNAADGVGGGIRNNTGATLNLSNATVSGNTARGNAGGRSVSLRHTTTWNCGKYLAQAAAPPAVGGSPGRGSLIGPW